MSEVENGPIGLDSIMMEIEVTWGVTDKNGIGAIDGSSYLHANEEFILRVDEPGKEKLYWLWIHVVNRKKRMVARNDSSNPPMGSGSNRHNSGFRYNTKQGSQQGVDWSPSNEHRSQSALNNNDLNKQDVQDLDISNRGNPSL
ncbi:hypothetical protein V6N13_082362 [Hibiscus sabdariffa]|uniref:Uncharacterized protein n=1 Tax=Hibiscus sabdariffa TaxID=183260 RepID=A0ABR2Q389_9ROSI